MGMAAVLSVLGLASAFGTASATELCSVSSTPCGGGMYVSGTASKASLVSGTLLIIPNSTSDIYCTESTIQGKTTSTGGSFSSVTGEVTSISFFGCETESGNACSTVTLNLPYSVSIGGGGAGGFTFTVTDGTGIGATFHCGTLKCSYATKKSEFSGENDSGAPAMGMADSLVASGSGCSGPAAWGGSYTVIQPSPLWVL
jgi:hypothetical protein